MPLSGNVGNYLQSSHFPVSSTMMIQPVSHYTSCKYIARTFSCVELGSATIPSLLLTHHMTGSRTNESNLPRSIRGEGGKGFFIRQQKKKIQEKQTSKKLPQGSACPHSHLQHDFVQIHSVHQRHIFLQVGPISSSQRSERLHLEQKQQQHRDTESTSLPAARLFSNNEQIKPGTCEGKMNAYPGDKRARHELLQKGCEDLVLHFTKKWLTSMQLLWCRKSR